MKRKTLLGCSLLLCLLLCACSQILPSEYVQLQPHNTAEAPLQTDALSASTFSELKSSILSLIKTGTEHGKIRVYSYDGDIEQDLSRAVLEVTRDEPLGAYAVDYISHSCSLIVSYYEISIDVTFRRSVAQMQKIEYYSSGVSTEAKERLRRAVRTGEKSLVMHFAYYINADFKQMIRDYFDEEPQTIIAMPEVTVSQYPENGSARIVEITMDFPETAQRLAQMQKAVEENVGAAVVYSRYSASDFGRADLLLHYLTERFSYEEKDSKTPVYSLFCEGLADSEAAAKGWKLLCDAAELPCYTVKGLKSGREYWWNIVQLDGRFMHVDPLTALLTNTFATYTDAQMPDYYWNSADYPACTPVPAVQVETPPAAKPADEPEE